MVRRATTPLGSLFGVFLLCAAGFSGPAQADVVKMKDGRSFEGTVYADKGDTVQFDTVVAGIRARLSLAKADIRTLDRKPLSAPQEASETEPGLAQDKPSPDAVTLYLEIPIKGRLREETLVQPIRSTLAYARLKKVQHIVFTVDGTGGPVDEAAAIGKTLREFEKSFTYHAIIAHCTGETVIVPFMCQTLHVQPGAKIGGLEQKLENLPSRTANKEEQVVRVQMADRLSEEARKRGRKGEIIRALVDPTVSLAAWVDSKGEVEVGQSPPAGLPKAQLIFADGPDTVLTLSFEQAVRLGIPSITGGPAALGDLLGLPNWREESSYGRDTMAKAAETRKRRANEAQAQFEDAVARNVHMRQTLPESIQSNLKQAAGWNPTKASYKSLSNYWAYWNPGAEWDTNVWTPDSRMKWQSRSDACAHYLLKARDGITSMMKLDKEAVSLGLTPTFKEGDLANMLEDVNIKLKMLSTFRNRAGD